MRRGKHKKKSIILSENLFIFDLKDKCFWQLTEVSLANISSIKFVPPHFNGNRKQNPKDEALSGHGRSSNLLIGNKSGFIYEIEISKYTLNFICGCHAVIFHILERQKLIFIVFVLELD